MMDLQAAIGIHQLPRVEDYWRRRREIWQRYDEAFADLPLFTPHPPEPETRHAYHLYTILLDIDRIDPDPRPVSRRDDPAEDRRGGPLPRPAPPPLLPGALRLQAGRPAEHRVDLRTDRLAAPVAETDRPGMWTTWSRRCGTSWPDEVKGYAGSPPADGRLTEDNRHNGVWPGSSSAAGGGTGVCGPFPARCGTPALHPRAAPLGHHPGLPVYRPPPEGGLPDQRRGPFPLRPLSHHLVPDPDPPALSLRLLQQLRQGASAPWPRGKQAGSGDATSIPTATSLPADIPAEAADELRRTVACVQRIHGGRPFVNKNVRHMQRIGALDAIFEGALFLVVSRPPADVALSLLRARYQVQDDPLVLVVGSAA